MCVDVINMKITYRWGRRKGTYMVERVLNFMLMQYQLKEDYKRLDMYVVILRETTRNTQRSPPKNRNKSRILNVSR